MIFLLYACNLSLIVLIFTILHDVNTKPLADNSESKLRNSDFSSGENNLETLSWSVELKPPREREESAAEYDRLADIVAADADLRNEGQIASLVGHYLFTHEIHSDIAEKLKDEHLWYGLQNTHNITYTSTTAESSITTQVSPTSNEHCKHSTPGKPVLHDLVSVSHNDWIEHIRTAHRALDSHPLVKSYRQEVIRLRHKRSVLKFSDPVFDIQWHLVNKKNRKYDINVMDVWAHNITGQGVTAAVVDDGLEWRNPDLFDNYSPEGSWDLNSNDPDPTPHGEKEKNHHGTRCAGEIAAVANNGKCGVGVAYGAKIAGIRVLDGPMTDSLEATAFLKNYDVNDVYSCSWGPDDDGKTVDGPHYLANTALRHGVEYGRQGYGAVYVVASGNGGRYGDNCNFDGYANSIYTITIGAVDEDGAMPYYAEECASMLAVTFSSGSGNTRNIVTTDWTKDGGTGCTRDHTGTSAAAPIAAGIVALVLSARPCLTWRDIQHIIIMSAVKVDIDLAHWTTNKAGLHHSHKHGFGLMDAWRLVNTAKAWKPVPWLTVFSSEKLKENQAIPMHPEKLRIDHEITPEMLSGYNLYTLEYVQVTVTITHRRRGDLMVWLQCPTTTMSVLAATRKLDDSKEGFMSWTFSTVRCWGEEPAGTWKLLVTDKGRATESGGRLIDWNLKLFGSPMSPDEIADRLRYVEEAASGKYLKDNSTAPCPPPPVKTKLVAPISEKTLKILILISGGCMFMAIYEALEYTFCYDEEKKEYKKQQKLAARARASIDESVDLPSTSSGREISESTRLLDAEEIPLDTMMDHSDGVTNVSCVADVNCTPDGEAGLSPGVEENVLFDRTDLFGDVFVDVDIDSDILLPTAGREAANTAQVSLLDNSSTNRTAESSKLTNHCHSNVPPDVTGNPFLNSSNNNVTSTPPNARVHERGRHLQLDNLLSASLLPDVLYE